MDISQSPQERAIDFNLPHEAKQSSAYKCLAPLLSALGDHSPHYRIMETFPYLEGIQARDDVVECLVRLRYSVKTHKISLDQVERVGFPGLFEDKKGRLFVVSVDKEGHLVLFDGHSGKEQVVEHVKDLNGLGKGTYFKFKKAAHDEYALENKKLGWTNSILARFRNLLLQMFAISFFNALFALAVPVFIMTTYDKAIGTRSLDTLGYLVLAVSAVLAADLVLRGIRAFAFAKLGTRMSFIVGQMVFRKLIKMPVAMVEQAPVGTQIARIKQFDELRGAFSSGTISTLYDLPFVPLYLLAIGIFGGPIVWVPLIVALLFTLLMLVTKPTHKKFTIKTGDMKNRLNQLALETVSKHRTIVQNHAQRTWHKRYTDMLGRSIELNAKAQHFNMVLQNLSQGLVVGGGAATLGLGAYLASTNDVTIGALIASVALVWKALAPMQQCFLNYSKLIQLGETIVQLNNMALIKTEDNRGGFKSANHVPKGQITLRGVTHRYGTSPTPSMVGVTMEVKRGEMVAITGPSGSGKSTLLNLLTSLYQPLAGAILMDGVDIRQIHTKDLRRNIGNAPQYARFFHGTVMQNLRLINQNLTAEGAQRALDMAGIEADELENGLETRIDATSGKLPKSLLQRLNLARAYCSEAHILLFDEPGKSLTWEQDDQFVAQLKGLKGQKTILCVTHRPAHMKVADRVVYMDKGQVIMEGTPDEVLDFINQKVAA